MPKTTLTDAVVIARAHFERETGTRGLLVFEVLSGIEVPEKGVWELRCRVRSSDSGTMDLVREETRESEMKP